MPPSYKQNKIHIYKWLEQNREKHNYNQARSIRWRRIKREFLNILII